MELPEVVYPNSQFIETVSYYRFKFFSFIFFNIIFKMFVIKPEDKTPSEVIVFYRSILLFFSINYFNIQAKLLHKASGNKVSRESFLCGSQNIVLNGKVRFCINETFPILTFKMSFIIAIVMCL